MRRSNWRSCVFLQCGGIEHGPDATAIAGAHVLRGQQMADECRDVAFEETAGEFTDRGVLHLRFGDERAVDELSGVDAMRHDAAASDS